MEFVAGDDDDLADLNGDEMNDYVLYCPLDGA